MIRYLDPWGYKGLDLGGELSGASRYRARALSLGVKSCGLKVRVKGLNPKPYKPFRL